MDDQTRTELEAAAFRQLVTHLRERTDVQNIDLMGCRLCRRLSQHLMVRSSVARGTTLHWFSLISIDFH